MRIEPTHFIKSYNSMLFDFAVNTKRIKISKLNENLRLSSFLGHPVVALFLIREKTPSEKAEWGSRVKELTESCQHGVPYRYDCEYCRECIEPYTCQHGVDALLGCPQCMNNI